jgi:signal peptidase I
MTVWPEKMHGGHELTANKIHGPDDPRSAGPHFYLGESMKGTFRPGDWLRIERTDWGEIACGDVVVFKCQSQGEESIVVHRVISRTILALVTRGDANPEPDAHPVAEPECLGRVVAFERGGRRRIVRKGKMGLLHARRVRAGRVLLRILFRPFRPFFRHARERDWIGALFHESIQEVHFITPRGPLVKFIRRGKTVGTWRPDEKQLLCGRIGRMLLWARVHAGVKGKSEK